MNLELVHCRLQKLCYHHHKQHADVPATVHLLQAGPALLRLPRAACQQAQHARYIHAKISRWEAEGMPAEPGSKNLLKGIRGARPGTAGKGQDGRRWRGHRFGPESIAAGKELGGTAQLVRSRGCGGRVSRCKECAAASLAPMVAAHRADASLFIAAIFKAAGGGPGGLLPAGPTGSPSGPPEGPPRSSGCPGLSTACQG